MENTPNYIVKTALQNESSNQNFTISVLPETKTEQKNIVQTIEKQTQTSTENENENQYFRLVLNFGDLLDFNDDDILLRLSAQNPFLRLETDRNNNLIVLMPTHTETGKFNSLLNLNLGIWNQKEALGDVYDSNAGFRMPITNSIKSPDVSFILHSRLDELTGKDKDGFYKIAPDFVIELRSDSDRLQEVIEKMLEYIENGVRLGWLIDPQTENVHIYRLNGNHTIQSFDEKLSGEDVLPKFELNVRGIFKKK
jgi:Uma2 family endonuclease